jgi:hypothetical protein
MLKPPSFAKPKCNSPAYSKFQQIDDRILGIIGSKNRGHVGGGRHEVRAERDVIKIY